MNRRQALGSLAALLVPTWKFKPVAAEPLVIPFHEFVDKGSYSLRYDMNEPFVQPGLVDGAKPWPGMPEQDEEVEQETVSGSYFDPDLGEVELNYAEGYA